MRLVLGLFLAGLCAAQTVVVSGTFKAPDGTPLTGRITTELARPTVINTCVSGTQVVALRQVQTAITAGVLGTLNLYPNSCLQIGVSQNAQIQPGIGAGIGATVGVTGKYFGVVTVTSGTGSVASATVATVTLHVPPLLYCYMLATSDVSKASGVDYLVDQGRSITIRTQTAALAAATTYTWNYGCIEPYTVAVRDSSNQLVYTGQWIVPTGFNPADVTIIDITHMDERGSVRRVGTPRRP